MLFGRTARVSASVLRIWSGVTVISLRNVLRSTSYDSNPCSRTFLVDGCQCRSSCIEEYISIRSSGSGGCAYSTPQCRSLIQLDVSRIYLEDIMSGVSEYVCIVRNRNQCTIRIDCPLINIVRIEIDTTSTVAFQSDIDSLQLQVAFVVSWCCGNLNCEGSAWIGFQCHYGVISWTVVVLRNNK